MGLARAVIRVLAEDHHLDARERREIQRPEIFGALGEYPLAGGLFLQQEFL
ncbi:hypothetical protein D3C87_2135440 [compost metagenome]